MDEPLSNLDAKLRVQMRTEISKLHEECVRGTLEEVAAHFEANEPRGEFVLIVEGRGKA